MLLPGCDTLSQAALTTIHWSGLTQRARKPSPWSRGEDHRLEAAASRSHRARTRHPAREQKKKSRSVSRVLSWTIIHLRQASPPACSDLPESAAGRSTRIPIWSCSEWGLPSPRLLPAARCALTAPFHPYRTTEVVRRYTFCCTFRRLAPPRCYLAPCPVEPGLSSPPAAKAAQQSDRLTDSAARLPAAASWRNTANRIIRHPLDPADPADTGTTGFYAAR